MSSRDYTPYALLLAGVAVFTLTLGYVFCWVTVPAGHVGVMSWFGDVSDVTLAPGPHLVSPFKAVYRIDCQTQKNEEPATVPTRTGIVVHLKAVCSTASTRPLPPAWSPDGMPLFREASPPKK